MRGMLVAMLAVTACASQPVAVPAIQSAAPSPATSRSPAPTARPTPLTTATDPPIASASAVPGEIHYVAIGASDTVGVGSLDPANGSWPSRVAALLPPGSTYANLGISGSLTAQAEREQLPAAILQRPTVVSVWLAVNDLSSSVPPVDHAASLGRIVDALVARTTAKVFVGNVPDLRAVPSFAASDPATLIALVQAYNAGIAAVVAKHSGRVFAVDLFTGSADLTSQLTVSSDGLHPSDAGYVLIAQRFATAMRASGIALRLGP